MPLAEISIGPLQTPAPTTHETVMAPLVSTANTSVWLNQTAGRQRRAWSAEVLPAANSLGPIPGSTAGDPTHRNIPIPTNSEHVRLRRQAELLAAREWRAG